MTTQNENLIVVLGPTASGKTALGVRLAHALGGEVLSADSRQVYQGLDIGAGKDLEEYRVAGKATEAAQAPETVIVPTASGGATSPALEDPASLGSFARAGSGTPFEGGKGGGSRRGVIGRASGSVHGSTCVPYHLIDICTLDTEYSLFDWQQAFYAAFSDVQARAKMPVLVGGTGLYLEAALQGYRMVEAPPNPALRAELAQLPDEALHARLLTLRPDQHNATDLIDRERCIRAIEIAARARTHPPPPAPEIRPLVLGIVWQREVLRQRIATRLKTRLEAGLVEEVQGLHQAGYSWERLELLGLEYRYVAQFLQGVIRSENDLFQKLNSAIAQFAKRQETWFRRMERGGIEIHWIARGEWDTAWALAQRLLG